MEGVATEAPRGTLMAIGGNEDKRFSKDVLRRLVELPGHARRVLVVPTASTLSEELARDYRSAFGDLGVDVDILDIRDRTEADDPAAVRKVEEADIVFLTGGDQVRLTSVLGGTPVHRAIEALHQKGGVVAGTSAGAAAMSATMISEGDAKSVRRGNVQATAGLGLVTGCVIDTHFLDRGRLSRLLEVVAANPACIGLGISEDTALLIREDRVEVVGSGLVVVVDGQEVKHTNMAEVEAEGPVAIERVIVHTLPEGYAFDLRTRAYLPGDPAKVRTDRRARDVRERADRDNRERREIERRDREAREREREAEERRERERQARA